MYQLYFYQLAKETNIKIRLNDISPCSAPRFWSLACPSRVVISWISFSCNRIWEDLFRKPVGRYCKYVIITSCISFVGTWGVSHQESSSDDYEPRLQKKLLPFAMSWKLQSKCGRSNNVFCALRSGRHHWRFPNWRTDDYREYRLVQVPRCDLWRGGVTWRAGWLSTVLFQCSFWHRFNDLC